MKRRNYRKEYSTFTLPQLQAEKITLEHTIKSCEEYIKTAYNTFLGPLGATYTIKNSCIRIEVINSLIREKENETTRNSTDEEK